jgi:parallel beta-helix repeat protein
LGDVFAMPGTWKTDGESVTVHFPQPYATPDKHLVELSVRGRIFAPYQRGLGYIQVKGFIMSHCANNACEDFYNRGSRYPQAGALGCRGGHDWLIEGNTIRWANGVGLDCGIEGPYDLDGLNQPVNRRPGNHVIRNNIISDNGAAGIVGENPRASRIIGNVFERNHYLGYSSMESAAIKLHSLNNGLIEGNLFRDNATGGVWLDNGASGSRVTRNVFVRNRGAVPRAWPRSDAGGQQHPGADDDGRRPARRRDLQP